jgi:hypothetical protein
VVLQSIVVFPQMLGWDVVARVVLVPPEDGERVLDGDLEEPGDLV